MSSTIDYLDKARRESVQRERAEGIAVENMTDAGNAARLIRLHGEDLRYVGLWRRWLAWDGQRWAIDETGEVMRRAKATVQRMYFEAANSHDGVRESLGK